MTRDFCIHVLRNPYGHSEDVKRSAALFACSEIEALESNTRPTGPSVPLELLEDCLAKIEAYSRELQGRYCGGVPNNILLPQLREAIKRLGATPRPIEKEKP